MAAPLLPQDVTEHLTAAIELSNRHIHLRFLEQADALLSHQFPAAAIVIAGLVLEFLVGGQPCPATSDELHQIERWTNLRNDAVHTHGRTLTMEEAEEMVAGVRQLLLRTTARGPRLAFRTSAEKTSASVRGKYKSVRTSSEQFIARKADELRLEHS